MNKKKLMIIALVLVVVAVGAGGAYAFVLPHKPAAKPHLVGTLFTLGGSFTLNLSGGHYASVSVALLIPPGNPPAPADQPVIDSIITNAVTGQPESALITARGRAILSAVILKAINGQTNATVSHVYFTNLAVQ